MMIRKYFDQKHDSLGKPLWWPGTSEGYPVRGELPKDLKQEEYENIPIVYDAKVDILELPRDNEKYAAIVDKCANGWYVLRHEKIEFDPTKGIYRVFLQWLEIYGESSIKKSPFYTDQVS